MPSLSVLFAKRSLRSFIESVRSALSLQSFRSHNTGHSQRVAEINKANKRPYKEIYDNKSTASEAYMVPQDNVGVESFIMGDLEGGQGGHINEGEIHVQNVISQENVI